MPSLVTSVVGGIQTRNAVGHAEEAQINALNQAGQTVTAGITDANGQIQTAGDKAAAGMTDATGAAAAGVRQAGSDAAGATDAAVTAGQSGVTAAGAEAKGILSDAKGVLNPYIDAGGRAVKTMEDLINGPGSKFEFSEDDPSYKWRLEQGQKALERSAAARGGLQSGGTLKALTRYAQGAASTEYQAAFNRWNTGRSTSGTIAGTLAGYGLNASGKAADLDVKAADITTRGAEINADLGLRGSAVAGGFRTGAARDAGQFDVAGAQYAGNAGMWSSGKQADNKVHGAEYLAQTQLGVGDAKASAHMGRANAWNSMLTGIGQAGNSIIAGGYSGGGGFKIGDIFKPPKTR